MSALADSYVGLIRRRFLPIGCSWCVSGNASVSVARRGVIVTCRDLPTAILFKKFGGVVRWCDDTG